MWTPGFGEAVVRHAIADLNMGVHEDLGTNDGHRIREYANHFGLVPPLNWCAVATSCWLLEGALEIAVPSPIAGSPAARGVQYQLSKAGLWVPFHRIEQKHIVPGSVIIWWRGDPNGWQGHVGIIEHGLDPMATVQTIEGNSGPKGDRVARMVRNLNDPHLLGIGCFGSEAPHEVNTLVEAGLRKYHDLSVEVMLGEPQDPIAELDR